MGKSTISMAIFNSYFDITRGYPSYPSFLDRVGQALTNSRISSNVWASVRAFAKRCSCFSLPNFWMSGATLVVLKWRIFQLHSVAVGMLIQSAINMFFSARYLGFGMVCEKMGRPQQLMSTSFSEKSIICCIRHFGLGWHWFIDISLAFGSFSFQHPPSIVWSLFTPGPFWSELGLIGMPQFGYVLSTDQLRKKHAEYLPSGNLT